MFEIGNGWRFPLCDYGEVKGINDAGVETFNSESLKSLIRESLQNSLDASSGGAVRVEFQEYELPTAQIPGNNDLVSAFRQCRDEGDEQARDFFTNALEVASHKAVRVMRISDHGTTGLKGADTCARGTDWSRLIKESGSSGKGDKSGGSFGIGKYSSFACSDFRTVFFSSMDEDGIESHVGVSRLTTFRPDGSEKYTTGIGYYSGTERNEAIRSQLSLEGLKKRSTDDPGTDILILGFKCDGDITREVIKHVLVQFLVSIWKGKLSVVVNGQEVNDANLGLYVSKLNDQDPDEQVRETIEHYDMLTSTDDESVRIIEFDPSELRDNGKAGKFGWEKGDCMLFLKQGGSNLNRRVMYTRAAGMRLFNQKNISGSIRFTGILMIEGETMNRDFREMEAPSHDKWAPERAKDASKAEAMVKQLRGWVIDKVKESFSKSVEDQMEAYGTALYLPEREPEKADDDAEEAEGLDHTITEVTAKDTTPKRDERMALGESNLTPDPDGEGIIFSHGEGERGSSHRRGRPGGDAQGFVPVKVRKRLVCTDREKGEYRLTFTVPHTAKKVRILLSTLGEQGPDPIGVRSVKPLSGIGEGITFSDNALFLGRVEKDAVASISFRTGYPQYCMMGADYYEAK